MSLFNAVKNQLKSVIQWNDPQEWELFRKLEGNDETKNASRLIIQPGQGCIFTYEGKLSDVFTEPGNYDIDTDNHPFLTTLKKWKFLFESDHKTGFWFFRTAEIVNMRWGTRIPITYNDPVYAFPVNLRAYGNSSLKITDAAGFFTRIVAGADTYSAYDLQELILSRISQPIGHYLANAKFSYAEIASHLNTIALEAASKTKADFAALGFTLLDFRLEGCSFDDETNQRIAGISNIQADLKAAQLAGVSFESLQKMIAMRDAAKNENGLGAAIITNQQLPTSQQSFETSDTGNGSSVKSKLKELKELLDEGFITEEEFNSKKQELLKNF